MVLNYLLIGRRISKRRKELKFTQWQVEEKADLCQKYMSNIEMGRTRTSIDTLVKICHVLQCTPNEILLGTSMQDTTDFVHVVSLHTDGMEIRKKQFLLEFLEFLKETDF